MLLYVSLIIMLRSFCSVGIPDSRTEQQQGFIIITAREKYRVPKTIKHPSRKLRSYHRLLLYNSYNIL